VAVNLIKSQWSSGNLVFKSKVSSSVPVFQVGQTTYGVQAKFHQRPATAGSVVEVRSRPSSADATAHAAVDSTLDWRATGDTVTAGYSRAVQGVCRMDAGNTITGGSLTGVYGQVALNATAVANGATVFMSAIYGLIEDGGTYTAVNHLCSAWLDSHVTKTISAGRYSCAYLTNNGSTNWDQVFYIYAGASKLSTIADPTKSFVSDETAGDYTFNGYRKVKVSLGTDGTDVGYIIVDMA